MQRYFEPVKGGTDRSTTTFATSCDFHYHNLIKEPYPLALMGNWDVIFCRNVTIYFRLESTRRVVHNFFDVAQPGRLPVRRPLRDAHVDLRPLRAGRDRRGLPVPQARPRAGCSPSTRSLAPGESESAAAAAAAASATDQRSAQVARTATERRRKARRTAAAAELARAARALATRIRGGLGSEAAASVGELIARAHGLLEAGDMRGALSAGRRGREARPATPTRTLAARTRTPTRATRRGDRRMRARARDQPAAGRPRATSSASSTSGRATSGSGHRASSSGPSTSTATSCSRTSTSRTCIASQGATDDACREYENTLRAL